MTNGEPIVHSCATHLHLLNRDMDEFFVDVNGLKPKEGRIENILVPRKCPRCDMKNRTTAKFRSRCDDILDNQTAVTMEGQIRKMDEKFSKGVSPVLLTVRWSMMSSILGAVISTT
ncbi:MAG: hypothetical protein JSW28_02610 [Thermoplasmata archaeon]|nr:MAG: hypothetical protein JSW28_02610 [Thermoplasmata archaeon]